MTNVIKTVSLAIIAACYLANTVVVYQADGGGTNVYFGNLGYHIAGESDL